MSSAANAKRLALSRLLQGPPLAVPGVHDALSAMLAERAGFQLLYVGSYATAAARSSVGRTKKNLPRKAAGDLYFGTTRA